jgi:hypothetical protein
MSGQNTCLYVCVRLAKTKMPYFDLRTLATTVQKAKARTQKINQDAEPKWLRDNSVSEIVKVQIVKESSADYFIAAGIKNKSFSISLRSIASVEWMAIDRAQKNKYTSIITIPIVIKQVSDIPSPSNSQESQLRRA